MRHRYRRVIRHGWRQWPRLLAVAGLTAILSGVTALQPWPLKILVDHGLEREPLPEALRRGLESTGIQGGGMLVVLCGLGALLLLLTAAVLNAALAWLWSAAGQRMVLDLAAELFAHLQRLSLRFHGRRSVGDALSRIEGDAYSLYTATDGLLIAPGKHLLVLVTLGALEWRLDPGLAAVSFALAPLLGASMLLFGRRLKQRSRQQREAHARLTSHVHQTLTAIPEVQAFAAEPRNSSRFRRLAGDAATSFQRGRTLEIAHEHLAVLITTLATAVVLFLGGRRVFAGALSLGTLLVFVAYLQSMQEACRGLAETYVKLKSVEAKLERVLEVLETKEEVQDLPGARRLGEGASPVRGHVRLENVTFGYEAQRAVLEDVTLEARPGETVALVGRTGAGKSTLVSLIPRFFDPWRGRVTLDGVDVREIQLASLRAEIALVLQQPFLLPLSVSENIAYGRPKASFEEIVAAAEAARADEFIRRLPRGYETVLGERGATLSGGEKQRLAVARALVRGAPVLLLDEPTAALDVETETLLLEALEHLVAGRATFVIAHRLSTLRNADRIAVLEAGRIVELGTHEELLRSAGAYQRLYRHQFPAAREFVG